MSDERWQRIIRVMGEAFDDYEAGLVALRKRVVADVNRKLNDGTVPDRPRRGARSRSAPASRRG